MKIALINSLFFPHENYHLVNEYYETSEIFFRSAKKNFLPHYDVHHILISNISRKHPLDFVEHIVTDYMPYEFHHILLMKILCLQFLKEEYDYIFVADADQLVTSQINDNDILDVDYVFMRHFFNALFKDLVNTMTRCIDVKYTDTDGWTMGNFYGGKYEHVMKMYEMAQKIHNELYLKCIMPEHGFYCKFPDELFIAKYAYENDVNYKVLTSNASFTNIENIFLSDFSTQVEDYKHSDNVKILHNTKKDVKLLKELIKNYE
jgi:hypothetical protein